MMIMAPKANLCMKVILVENQIAIFLVRESAWNQCKERVDVFLAFFVYKNELLEKQEELV